VKPNISAEFCKGANPDTAGFRNRQGKPWNKNLILYLLKNETYTGTLMIGINESGIMSRKAFLNSFIRRINIKDSEAEIEYTCPIGLGENRRNEVLSMARIGSIPIHRENLQPHG
jgi:hypothetical protein